MISAFANSRLIAVKAGEPGPYAQNQIRTSSPFIGRDGAGLIALGNTLLLCGGWDPAAPAEFGGNVTTNEVWISYDRGRTWTQLLAHVDDPPTSGAGARWRRRHTAGWLKHRVGSTDYAYVIGGDHYDSAFMAPNFPNDVWRSADGETWERMTDTAPCSDRMLHMCASYNGNLYIMGGQDTLADPLTAKNDVWRSTDDGATWTQLADAPWANRAMVYNPFEFKGKLWLIGGGTYADDPGDRDFYNDVWTFDDNTDTWTEVLADGHGQWTGRQYHNTIAAGGLLWVLSGYGHDGVSLNNLNDIYNSPDGVTWTSFGDGLWPLSHADGLCAMGDRIFRATGNSFDTGVFEIYRGSPTPDGV